MIFGPKADGTFRTANFRPGSVTCPSRGSRSTSWSLPTRR